MPVQTITVQPAMSRTLLSGRKPGLAGISHLQYRFCFAETCNDTCRTDVDRKFVLADTTKVLGTGTSTGSDGSIQLRKECCQSAVIFGGCNNTRLIVLGTWDGPDLRC